MALGTCSSCGANVVWAHNDNTGGRAPIDIKPTDDGPIVMLPDGIYHVLSKAELEAGEHSTIRFTNHFQTCPNARSHRKR